MYTTRDIVNDWRREAIAARKESVAKDNTIYSLQYDNIAKDNIIAAKDNAIAAKDNAIAAKDNAIAELQRRLQQAGLN